MIGAIVIKLNVPIMQALAPCLEKAGCRWVDGLVPRHSLYG